MTYKRGFTLIEIIVVMVIIGILAIIAVPVYTSSIQQGMAQAAYNNLRIIYNAQKNYFFQYGSYCGAHCGSEGAINSSLVLNIAGSNYSYSCSTTPAPNPTFQCYAIGPGGSTIQFITNTSFWMCEFGACQQVNQN